MGARTGAVRAIVIVLAAAAAVWAVCSYRAVYVGGDSMAPSLARGDLVLVRRGPMGVSEGDVVLVAKTGWPSGILHRVVAVGLDETLTLRGDANPTVDRDPVGPDSVLGVVAVVLPTGRVFAAVEGLMR